MTQRSAGWGARLVACCVLWLSACGGGERSSAPAPAAPARASGEIWVAAASDLGFAFDELAKQFTSKTGTKVNFTFGSTGLLAKQIEEGAPFDLFAAANVSFVDEVVQKGACDGKSQAPYARGRIVLWARPDLTKPPAKLEELADARFARIAIANPEHAPYGKAAQQALQKLGLWQKLEPRLVYGENIKQTLQYAQSGNAEVAIVALSLALGTKEGTFLEVPEALHAPIDQALVVCKNGKQAAGARAFAAYLASADGRSLMRRYGFLLPGETLVHHP